MKKWNVNALLHNDNTAFRYEFNITYEGVQQTLFSDQQFRKELLYKYTSFCISAPAFYDPGTSSYIEVAPDLASAVPYFEQLFSQWVQDRVHSFTKMYAALLAEYNPLWNIDGVEGLVTKTTRTGTDTMAHTGKDTVQASGNDTLSHTGTDTDTLSGTDTTDHDITTDQNVRTGSEALARTGNDTDTDQVATFDSGGNLMPERSKRTDYLSTDTTTYNSLTDSHTLDSTDATTYGKVDTLVHGHIETTAHGKKDETTYNSTNTNTKNLVDDYLEMKIRQGNIGVTKSTELIESEMKLRSDWDKLISQFIADFVHSYCIL